MTRSTSRPYVSPPASFLLFVNADDSYADDPAAGLGMHALRMGIRVAGVVLLLFGVWQIREQIHRAVAAAGVTLRVADLCPRAAPPAGA
ncbi:hypothetical protein Ade02nite_62220 [Paractinoplanes deccanensis]|uniref:Uncharacterized protein n=1 Tax=Paractinoplanes deccanensis TaxID=113561 RepID=A0ABQ3YC57_9ACTN|nr:hypothetical protein [Actinoplanes deccanensis]GID77581.1 hypothetical protein Ade02nite_62220 [Actinoplanes deccanensis]